MLPEFVDKEAWQGFVEMRKAFRPKKPFTDRAKQLIIKKLINFNALGRDVNAMLDEATEKGWLTVYPPKGDGYGQQFSGKPVSRRDSARDAITALGRAPEGHTGVPTAPSQLRIIK